jgi:glycosyltransferase involved in cell wall biosynthesis
VPLYLAAGHVAVAPFDPAKHPYLRHFGFYWSPLKVFEAMAAGLSVVTARVHPLSSLVRDGKEGFLFKPGSRAELLNALQRLLADPELSEELGARARERVVQDFSWQRHCAQLDRLLQELAG